MDNTVVKIRTLEANQNHESALFFFEKNWSVKFVPGPSLFAYDKIQIYTNYPFVDSNVQNKRKDQQQQAKFIRESYKELPLNYDGNKDNIVSQTMNWSATIKFILPGTYHYYYTSTAPGQPAEQLGSGYFQVRPKLNVGKDGHPLPLDCIQCQTILAKNLGTIDSWFDRLAVSYQCGYNMVHLTPIQELGGSNSAYSICDQLKLNPSFSPSSAGGGTSATSKLSQLMFSGKNRATKATFKDVAKIVKQLNEEWNMLFITDIVLNHTANESKWILEHPESTYNCHNSPHLRPAYMFDRAIFALTLDMANKRWLMTHGLGNQITCEGDLKLIKILLTTFYLPLVKIHEMFMVDIEKMVSDFDKFLLHLQQVDLNRNDVEPGIKVIQDKLYRRFHSTIDMVAAVKLTRQSSELRCLLKQENERIKQMIDGHLSDGLNNVFSAIRYERLQEDGPKLPYITPETPLVAPYFKAIDYPNSQEKVNLRKEDAFLYDERQSQFMMAHNGWVMNFDPLKNFAAEGELIYLRRELIAWGDSVKLRYGDKFDDSPFLWQHMREYVEQQAEIFHGLRLDNCHSTPIHVAQYLLDAARLIRPDLYIIAELFTSSEEADNIFINKLGITSLVRESMSASNSRELGRLMYRFGGQAFGAFHHPPGSQPLKPSTAHAIFYDQTHDNESPLLKRSPYDCQATTSIVSMACCASGTNRGYDELVPHHISVVGEKRLYQSWCYDDGATPSGVTNGTRRSSVKGRQRDSLSSNGLQSNQQPVQSGWVKSDTGIVPLRRLINDLHSRLYLDSFVEIFVDQVDDNVLAITRHNPHDCRSIILIARTAFQKILNPDEVGDPIRPIFVPGTIASILFEAKMVGDPSQYERSDIYINGLTSFRTSILNENLTTDKLDQSNLVRIDLSNSDQAKVQFDNFVPSSVLALESHASQSQSEALLKLRLWLKEHIDTCTPADRCYKVIEKLSLTDINYILYRCQAESGSAEYNEEDPVYELPEIGKFPYSGLQGFMFILTRVHDNQDQAHPLCCNLRQGNWLIDHTLNRLYKRKSLLQFANLLKEPLEAVGRLPRGIVPKYFDIVITSVYNMLVNFKIPNDLGSFVKTGPKLVKRLALSSLALTGKSRSSPLAPWSYPKPTGIKLDNNSRSTHKQPPNNADSINHQDSNLQFYDCCTLAAGLPHFASGYMRNWGRDTFIAMRGLLLLTERFDEARCMILSYAATLRHGLIPNLLDGGFKPRYNCRDAVWWWLYCIKEYTELSASTTNQKCNILEEQVHRIYPYDHSEAQMSADGDGREQPLYTIMQESIERHFDGIDFVERNAGLEIDEHMTEKGFHVQVNVDRATGFVYGGNQWNCGTWMDKMGSSVKAKTKGEPASPRDGAAVEIVGLSYTVIKWLAEMSARGKYHYKGVESKKNGDKWSWNDWMLKIEKNFEKHFWIDDHDERQDLVNRRHIYKDLWGCEKDWQAYQFRPNFLVTMVVAPELFSANNARQCLGTTRNILVGPLGMKTLDPSDWNYHGDYDNSDDSDNRATAHGFNYHQGPEWLWLTGFYLRALMQFSPREEVHLLQANVKHIKQLLANHYKHLENDPWFGLPELTNSNGQLCKDGCPIQAWSIGTIIESVYDLSKVKTIV